MPDRYVETSYLYPLAVQHVTYTVTGRAGQTTSAPGQPSSLPQSTTTTTTQTAAAQIAEPVYLDEMIRRKREKARRMKQR
jgi:hypothetical protein